MAEAKSQKPGWVSRLSRFAPGLPDLLNYGRANLSADLVAGLSVAAVALPVGVAYAQLAGFKPEVGLYASILPLVAYALFGTSRQLIVGPDAATCALVAAAVAPLAAGNESLYFSLSITLAFLAGVFCIIASFFRLGALADFLSKPILVGFLNGMALSIALGQIGKIFGFAIQRERIIPRLLEFVSKLGLTHPLTLIIGLLAFVVLAVSPRLIPRLPAALAAMIVTGAAVKLLGLDAAGVKTIGVVPEGLPPLRIPSFPLEFLPGLCASAAGVALIGFSSMMLTARSFAAKNRYEIDVDREFAALGAANIAAAISQGFAVSGADSRTAMSDASGGRTRVTGLVTAATVAAVLLFFTGPLQYVPVAALGAVLVKAAFSLLDLAALKTFYQVDKRELALSLLATLGVATVGAVQAILIAVVLALLRFVALVSRPKVEILGRVADMPGLHSIDRHQSAATISGLLLFRFNAPIVFFNAPFFKRSVLDAVGTAGPALKWFVIDMIPITMMDITGLQAVGDVIETLRARGIEFIAAGRETEWRHWAEKRRLTVGYRSFPTLRSALKRYERENSPIANSAGSDASPESKATTPQADNRIGT
jgi:high affinity sulfate transporter 1